MPSCDYKKGFLSLQSCGNPATAACSVCNRPVCHLHSRQSETGFACLDCYAQNIPEDQAKKEGLDAEQNRNAYYGQYGYLPYSATDYQTFDKKTVSGKRPDRGPIASEDFQGS